MPALRSIFFEFLLIGLVSFGGGIMAYERRLLLEKRKWLTNDEFMAILAMGQTMPGLNSVNLAMLSGRVLRLGSGGCVQPGCGLPVGECVVGRCVGRRDGFDCIGYVAYWSAAFQKMEISPCHSRHLCVYEFF